MIACIRVLGQTLGSRYKIVRLLGEGGMGRVYEAVRAGAGERVAIKVIRGGLSTSSDAVRRFRREVRAASSIDSEHIVRALDSGSDEGTGQLYLVMEYLEGEDLNQVIAERGPLPVQVSLALAAQALEGLKRAHEARVVHRDIKPANLFLTFGPDGNITVKILDFGIAKVKSNALSAPQTTALTETGNFLGSPLFMSPEQVQSSRDVDLRTDLWSLGTVLYCLLSGRAPHQSVASVGKLILTICTSPPKPLRDIAPEVPPEVAEVVHRALRINRDERYSSAAEMLEAILPLLDREARPNVSMLPPRAAAKAAPEASTITSDTDVNPIGLMAQARVMEPPLQTEDAAAGEPQKDISDAAFDQTILAGEAPDEKANGGQGSGGLSPDTAAPEPVSAIRPRRSLPAAAWIAGALLAGFAIVGLSYPLRSSLEGSGERDSGAAAAGGPAGPLPSAQAINEIKAPSAEAPAAAAPSSSNTRPELAAGDEKPWPATSTSSASAPAKPATTASAKTPAPEVSGRAEKQPPEAPDKGENDLMRTPE